MTNSLEQKKKQRLIIQPSPRIDWCGDCKKEHGYNCPKDKKHRHTWQYSHEDCPQCGYTERCCKNCSVCQGLTEDNKWEVVSD